MTWTLLHEACEKTGGAASSAAAAAARHLDDDDSAIERRLQEHVDRVLELVRLYPEHILQVDDHGCTPLHVLFLSLAATTTAASSGSKHLATSPTSAVTTARSSSYKDYHSIAVGKAIEAMLEACPQVATCQDWHGDTPLHVACCIPPSSSAYCRSDPCRYSYGCEGSVDAASKHYARLLLEACPESASTTNREGLQPLHMACRHAQNNVGVVGLLVQAYPHALRKRIKASVSIYLSIYLSGAS